jgi:hypothetical protein
VRGGGGAAAAMITYNGASHDTSRHCKQLRIYLAAC